MKPWLVRHRDNRHAMWCTRVVPGNSGARQFGTMAEFHQCRGRSGSYGSRREAASWAKQHAKRKP